MSPLRKVLFPKIVIVSNQWKGVKVVVLGISEWAQPCISAITEIELLCWNTEKETEQKLLEEFVKDCYIFDLDLTIKKETVKIRKASKVKLPDAIIAATSIVNNLTLLTRNVRDFQKIDSLEIINPWEV